MSQANLTLFEANLTSFLERSLTQDEQLGPPLRARDQTTIHAGETPLFSPSKEGQAGVIGLEGNGLRLLGSGNGHCVH